MPDNVQAAAATGGPTFATDADDGVSPAVHYPWFKLCFGPNDTFTKVQSGVGLPVHQQTGANWAINLAQYVGSTIGADNAVHVRPGTGATFSVDTELPDAQVAGDAMANPTAPPVLSHLCGWNGAVWVRVTSAGHGQLLSGAEQGFFILGSDGSTWNRIYSGPTNGELRVRQWTHNATANEAWPVRFSDGTNLIYATDNANNAIRVNVVAGGTGTSSSYGAAFPATGTAAGFSDGSTMQHARVYDLDTGAGTEMALGVELHVAASGGSARVGGDAANGLDVDVTRVGGNVTVIQGTAGSLNCTEASAAGILTAVQIMDDWDESDRCKVNPISGQVGVAAGAGAVGATVQRMTLASDDPAVASLSVMDDWDSSDACKVVGNVADGAADSGNSVKFGVIARNPDSMPADETAADRVPCAGDLKGRLIVYLGTRLDVTNDGVNVAGPAAHDAAISGAPVRTGRRAVTANVTAVATGDTVDDVATLVGVGISKPYSIPEGDWQYAAAASGISNTTTAVTFKAAGAAGLRNYITAIQITAEALGAATELVIRDGAGGTELWRTKIGTSGIINGISINFPTPVRGTAATLLEVVTLTASITGSVYFNAQGYTAP